MPTGGLRASGWAVFLPSQCGLGVVVKAMTRTKSLQYGHPALPRAEPEDPRTHAVCLNHAVRSRRRGTPQRTQSIAEAAKRRPNPAEASPVGAVRPTLGDDETDTLVGAHPGFSSPYWTEAVGEQRHFVLIVRPPPSFRKRSGLVE
jgi:hypothetical protein